MVLEVGRYVGQGGGGGDQDTLVILLVIGV